MTVTYLYLKPASHACEARVTDRCQHRRHRTLLAAPHDVLVQKIEESSQTFQATQPRSYSHKKGAC